MTQQPGQFFGPLPQGNKSGRTWSEDQLRPWLKSMGKGTDLPWGVLGYAETTTPQGSLTSLATDLTDLTVTVSVPAGRLVRITGFVPIGSDAANNTCRVGIWETTTELNSWDVNSSLANVRYGTYPAVVVEPSAGSHTYKLRGGRASGAGTVGTGASATRPAFILVEDLGPA